MSVRDIIVVAGSAGAIQEVRTLVGALPRGFAGAVFVVLHTATEGPGLLAGILARSGPLEATMARQGEPIEHGHVYVAPPNHHLLLTPGHIALGLGPRENGFRPAADPLFRTAAETYGPRVVGIVLSGGLDDGSLGLREIKEHGGVTIVQDPEEALHPSMPRSAMKSVEIDYVLSVRAMAAMLVELTERDTRKGGTAMKSRNKRVSDPAGAADLAMKADLLNGAPAPFVCPQCGGALWELQAGQLTHYRCHVGHGYTTDALLADMDKELEDALWVALRTLEDSAALRRRMGRDARDRKMPNLAKQYEEAAEGIEQRAGVIREVLLREALPRPLRGFGNDGPTKLLSKLSKQPSTPRRRGTARGTGGGNASGNGRRKK